MNRPALLESLLALDPAVRYAAINVHGAVAMRVRDGLPNASAAESDRYEELLVNPALLELTRRRGDIDCGGLDHVVVAYGRFIQLIVPFAAGHASLAFERGSEPQRFVRAVRAVLARHVERSPPACVAEGWASA